MMAEAQAITASLGLAIPEHMMERRLHAAGSVIGHKISMLQDLERGRSLEIDALITAVQEIGRLVGVPTPTIDVVLALIQERGRQAGLYGRRKPAASHGRNALLPQATLFEVGKIPM